MTSVAIMISRVTCSMAIPLSKSVMLVHLDCDFLLIGSSVAVHRATEYVAPIGQLGEFLSVVVQLFVRGQESRGRAVHVLHPDVHRLGQVFRHGTGCLHEYSSPLLQRGP